MTMDTFYLICFVVGLVLSVLTVLAASATSISATSATSTWDTTAPSRLTARIA